MKFNINRKSPIAVCFFNNKGGVGKTTLVANLAAELGLHHKKKVLLVDADPQCNLTQYVMHDSEFIAEYGSSEPQSIFTVIHPISIGKGYKDKLPTRKSKAFACDIVIGDPRLALKEDLLSQDWREAKAGGTRGLRTTFLFHDLISKGTDYDFIFFDMGPSLGAINRSLLLVADYFVLPASIDIFSSWAIQNIGVALGQWKKELKLGMSNAEDPDELPRNLTSGVKFIGYVTQQHKEKVSGSVSRIVEAYHQISAKLPSVVEANLKPLYAHPGIKVHLAEIKHLASLAPKSQTMHEPMISVKAKGSYTVTRKQARDIYSKLAAGFLENIALAERGQNEAD